MDKLNYFNYCSLVILVVLTAVILSRRMLRGRRNRYFWNLLLVVLCSVIFDILAVYLDNGAGVNVLEKYVAHGGYLILHNLSVPVYVIYLACLTDNMYKLRDNVWVQLLLIAPFACVLVMILTTPFFRMIFYIDKNGQYVRGPWYGGLYLVATFYIGLGVIYALRCRRLFTRGQFLSMLAVFPLMIAAWCVQIAEPGMRIEMFAHTMGILFILLVVQKPEERTDSATGFGKPSAYVTDVEQAVYNKRPIRILLINILNYRLLLDVLGYMSTKELMNLVAERIAQTCRTELPKADPYYLDRGRFCLIAGKENFHRLDSAAQALNEMLKEDVYMQDMNINLQSNLCILRCPEDLGDLRSILAFSNEFEEYEKTGKVFYAEEILNDGRYIIKDIENIIENAMTNEGMSVYYQPIYSVEEKRFVSAEALLRLNDEEYGHISPELFIPVAEKNGVIHRIGSFVLEEVCRFIASEEFQKLGMDYIEVNLSVAQCMRNNLANEILGLLEKYHVRPDQINLEITETAVADSQNIMAENVRILAEAGIPFSLDDFGTGYSNIRRMATLPLNIVKLDKTFTDLEDNPRLEIVVRNTVRMIKDMQMKIVVEGIETEEMAKHFSDMKCDYIQGFYYSRPLTREQFVSFISQAQ